MPTAAHDIIVLGCSSGCVEGLTKLVTALPAGVPAAFFVVCHIPAGTRSALPEILSRRGKLLATHARDGEAFYPGQIYLAPPDHHLLVEEGRVRVSRGPKENSFRPAIDPLFRSAARVYGSRVIGVVLTGALSDGVAGLMAIRAAGGIAIIQDPQDAIVGALPEKASRIAGADHVVTADEIPALLVRLIHNPASPKGGSAVVDPIEKLDERVNHDFQDQEQGQRRGESSVFSCPECGGVMWQVDDAKILRFRCHVGHAYAAEALVSEQEEALEAALWVAARTFRERAVLARQLTSIERTNGSRQSSERFEEQAQEAERHAALIVRLVTHDLDEGPGAEPAAKEPNRGSTG